MIFFLLTVGVIGWVFLTPNPAVAKQKLKKVVFLTNYVFHGRHLPFFVGMDKGFYKKAGFDIHIAPSTGSGFVVSALEGRKADYGMAESPAVVQAVAKGASVKGFQVFMDISTSGLASLKPYPTPESLKNARITASLTDSARVILPIIYRLKGLDPATINWQAADPGIYTQLLLEGKTDLYTASIDGDIPALKRIAAKRNKKVYFSSFGKWGYDIFGYFLVTQADRIAKHPKEVKAFAEATKEAVEYSIAHPKEAAKIMVEYNPTLDYDTTLAQWSQSIKAINTDYVKRNGYGVATQDRLQRTVDLVKQAFKLKGVALKPADVFDTSIVTAK